VTVTRYIVLRKQCQSSDLPVRHHDVTSKIPSVNGESGGLQAVPVPENAGKICQ
jgi:hypothetical protein